MNMKCPGAKIMRQPEPENFRCPSCGYEVEIWTDEISALCRNCSTVVKRFQDMSCIEWCKIAKECIGDRQYASYMKSRVKSVKLRLLTALGERFGSDRRRIKHARIVLRYAEEVLSREKGDSHIVIPAAILHDIGPWDDLDGQGKSKDEVAKKFLLKEGLQMDNIDEICEIIATLHEDRENGSMNYKIVHDAERLAHLKEESGRMKKMQAEAFFLTQAGRALAKRANLR
jgi:hypothetical protein